MKNPNNPVARQNGLVVQEMPDEVLVYDLDANKAHCLNQSAARVWKACDGDTSVADIVRQFDGKVTEDFVWLAIDQLGEKGLLANEMAPRFAGQSRRQVLKTIGLATVVALPVIASLVAPQSALASITCNCTTSAICAQRANLCPAATCNANGVCAP